VVSQPVEQLRAVCLRIDGLRFVALDECVALNAAGRRMLVGTVRTFADAGQGE
jgi:hypothetical protein